MDYGAPVGYRLALKHPERVTALIVQNGNAYEEGLKAFWDPIKAYWADGSEAHRAGARLSGRAGDDEVPVHRRRRRSRGIDPDNWGHDQPLLDRPGNKDIQLDLFLRLRNERSALSAIPGVLPRAQAADPDRLGQERQDLSRRRRDAVPAGPAGRRTASPRHGPLRARRQARRDGSADPGFPVP